MFLLHLILIKAQIKYLWDQSMEWYSKLMQIKPNYKKFISYKTNKYDHYL